MKLSDLYTPNEYEDEEETLGLAVMNNPGLVDIDFRVRHLPHAELVNLMTYFGEEQKIMDVYEDFADEDQRETVKAMIQNFDTDRIVVLENNRIVDGNHHVTAAILSGQDIRAIDLSNPEPDTDPESSPGP